MWRVRNEYRQIVGLNCSPVHIQNYTKCSYWDTIEGGENHIGNHHAADVHVKQSTRFPQVGFHYKPSGPYLKLLNSSL